MLNDASSFTRIINFVFIFECKCEFITIDYIKTVHSLLNYIFFPYLKLLYYQRKLDLKAGKKLI